MSLLSLPSKCLVYIHFYLHSFLFITRVRCSFSCTCLSGWIVLINIIYTLYCASRHQSLDWLGGCLFLVWMIMYHPTCLFWVFLCLNLNHLRDKIYIISFLFYILFQVGLYCFCWRRHEDAVLLWKCLTVWQYDCSSHMILLLPLSDDPSYCGCMCSLVYKGHSDYFCGVPLVSLFFHVTSSTKIW